MKNQREDMEAPDLPKPSKLSRGEMLAVYRHVEDGEDKAKLARYFNCTEKDIMNAYHTGRILKWI